MVVHLVDGTYELFRYFYSPAAAFERTRSVGARAVRGVVGSILGMLEGGATHLGVATDHVIESFRNALWPGYKTGEGIDPVLYAQFEPLEEALGALGVVVWPMVEFEADDALAAAAAMAAADARVDQVVVCTPDKDLAQCVRGNRVVQLDRRTREVRDEAGVRAEVRRPARRRSPTGSPWSATAPTAIPASPAGARRPPRRCSPAIGTSSTFPSWPPTGTCPCAARCAWPRRSTAQRERALLFRELATLRADAPIGADVDALRWTGPRPDFAAWAARLGRAGAPRARPGAGGGPGGRRALTRRASATPGS